MKLNRSAIWAFILLLVIAAVYRAWVDRPAGFAPHMAMAIFGGAVFADKRLALVLPLLSLFISDILYELLYINGLTNIAGFYEGQWVIYIAFALVAILGMFMKKINVINVLGFTISGSLLFFLVSNFGVWLGYGGLNRPHTFEGLLLCYGDAIAFYRDYGLFNGFVGNQLIGDIFFSAVLFGSFALIRKTSPKIQAA